MTSFLKMQLKMYFRQISSYAVPIVIGVLYLIIRLLLFISIEDKSKIETLLNSTVVMSSLANFTLFATFGIVALVGQTIFFKYKQEGVEIILFSKPLSKTKIYYTNLFAALICVIFSLFILYLGNLISLLIIPKISAKTIFLSSSTLLFASFLAALFILGFALILHLLVDLRIFQIFIGILPFLLIFVFGFIKTGAINRQQQVINSVQNNLLILTGKEKNFTNRTISNIQNSLDKEISLLAFNKSTKQIFNEYKNYDNQTLSLTKEVDLGNNNVYNKISNWNYFEYFYRVFILGQQKLMLENQNQQIKKIENDNNFQGANILKLVNFESKNNWLKPYYLAFKIDISIISEAIKNNFGTNKTQFSLEDFLDYYSFTNVIKDNLEYLKRLNTVFFDNLTNVDRSTYLKDIDNLKKEINFEGKVFEIADLSKIKIFLNSIKEDTELLNKLNQFVELLANNFTPSKSTDNASAEEKYNYQKQIAKIDSFKIELKSILTNSALTHLLALEINDENLILDFNDLDALLSENYQNFDYYQQNLLKPVILNNNIVQFKRQDIVSVHWAILIPLLTFTIGLFTGWIISIKKDYK
ncbi:hypothetical protein [Mycoplasmopsis columbina]|uniref:hypothetical protein n=2 Tax=Mycoplasmopsis columbina TaxID=114881 RepID=UPI00101D0CE2|nr:hypothetical protein [Mycoplasmopsis columbina]